MEKYTIQGRVWIIISSKIADSDESERSESAPDKEVKINKIKPISAIISIECNEYFHPSCLGQASNAKSAVCKHTIKKKEEITTMNNDMEVQNKILTVVNE